MIRFPDYSRSLPALSTRIAGYFGLEERTQPFPCEGLERALEKKPQRVFILVFDGLGSAQIERHFERDGFLPSHLAGHIDSVFPSTTAAAMNSVYSGMEPSRHGWLGWSLYFKQVGRAIDLFPRVDSVTKASVLGLFDPWPALAYTPILDRANDAGINSGFAAPKGILMPGLRHTPTLGAKDLDEWFEHLRQRAREEGPALTMAYWPEPDYSLHRHGPESPSVERIARDIDAGLCSLSSFLSRNDLVIVTGDHGHTEVDEYVDVGKIEAISEAMFMPPYLEARAAFFYVRQERRQSFERAVRECLGREFIMLTREEVLNQEAFGPREGAHPLFDSFVADYLVIATGKKALKYYEPLHDHGGDYPSHHAGLTEEEMRVPLAIFSGMDN